MPDLHVELLKVGAYQMNCYLISNVNTRELFIVDPGADAPYIISHIGDKYGRRPALVLSIVLMGLATVGIGTGVVAGPVSAWLRGVNPRRERAVIRPR